MLHLALMRHRPGSWRGVGGVVVGRETDSPRENWMSQKTCEDENLHFFLGFLTPAWGRLFYWPHMWLMTYAMWETH